MRAFAPSLLVLASCAHAAVAPCPLPPACPPPPAPAAPTLLDLRWQLRTGDAVQEPPPSLHSFTSGRWECALGPVQYEDTREANDVTLVRTRKIACTHASGTTVQSALRCRLMLAAPDVAPRSLPFALDSNPGHELSCNPTPVERLLVRNEQELGTLCATPEGLRDCAP